MLNHSSSKVVSPGPGAYDMDKSSIESPKVIRRPALGLVMRESRFKVSSLNQRFSEGGKDENQRARFHTGVSPSNRNNES